MTYRDRVTQRLNLLLGNLGDVETVINGVRLLPDQITTFRQLTSQSIPDPVRYRFDPDTGNLGFVGSPVPYYNVYAVAAPLAGRGGHSPSLSERRQRFSQADLTRLWVAGD